MSFDWRWLPKSSAFRFLWLANLLSLSGSHVSRIALVLYAFGASDNVMHVAILVSMETLPGAVSAPLVGTVIDRLPKRVSMIGADLARLLLLLAIVVWPDLVVIYVAIALHSIANVLFLAARTAALPSTVPTEDLPRANGADQCAYSLVLVGAPVIGAELFLKYGLVITLLCDGLSYLASAFLVARIKSIATLDREAFRSGNSVVEESLNGWKYVARHGAVRQLSALLFVALLCTGLWLPLAPFFIRDHIGASEHILGWQLGSLGLGGIAGGIVAPRIVSRFGRGMIVLSGFLAESGVLMIYSLTHNVVGSLIITFAWGLSVSVIVVPFYSILQVTVAKQFLGRVFALVKQVENAALATAMMFVVASHEVWDSAFILLVAGVVYFCCTVASVFTRQGRELFGSI